MTTKAGKEHGNVMTMKDRWARAARYEEALRKILRQKTSTRRSKTICIKALNGHLNGK